MSAHRWIAFSGAFLLTGILSVALSGCDGGGASGGSGEATKIAPTVNPAPGDFPADQESSPDNPANKKKK